MATKKVMVVEDFAILGKAMKEILELEGFEVVHARNGKDALDLIEKGNVPEVIVLDYKMPVMNGGELLEQLKGNEKTKPILAIAVSAAANQTACAKADHFLKKPLDTRELIRLIRTRCG